MITTKNKTNGTTPPKTKGRPKHFCKEDALDQALQVFCKKGYEATSIAELGEAMNMKPPSLYNAFGDKESLFIEVLERFHKPHMQAMERIFASTLDTREAIREVMTLSKEYHGKKGALGCLVVNSSINVRAADSRIAQKIKSIHDKNEAAIYKKLHEGQKNGDIPQSVKISKLARYVYGILQGATVVARGQQSPSAVKDLVDQGYEGFLKLVS